MDLNPKLMQLTIDLVTEHMYTKGKPDSYTEQFLNYEWWKRIQENVVTKNGFISIHLAWSTKDADGKVSKKSED